MIPRFRAGLTYDGITSEHLTDMFGAETPAGRGLALLALLEMAKPRLRTAHADDRTPRGSVRRIATEAREASPTILSLKPLAESED